MPVYRLSLESLYTWSEVVLMCLLSTWRVKFYRHREVGLGGKSSSRMALCKEKPRLNTRHRRKCCWIAKELSCGSACWPVFPLVVSSAASPRVALVGGAVDPYPCVFPCPLCFPFSYFSTWTQETYFL